MTSIIISFLLFLGTVLQNTSRKNDRTTLTDYEHHIKVNPTVTKFDNFLHTGWYYVIDTSGYKRNLEKTQQYYFIDPAPIVSKRNFHELKVYQSKYGDYGLMISLDDEGTTAWSIATQKAIGKSLAFILDNKLLAAPIVNAQITGGTTALNGGNYLQSELENFKKIIESEK